MPTVATATPSGGKTLYRAGSLVYDARGLFAVFAWLLGGEVIFTLIDMVEPKILPVILKHYGASDTSIGVIIGSFNAVLQLLIMPPLGYYSDRLRTRWGRRIPLLFLSIPFVTFFLVLTPFAPEIAGWLQERGGVGRLLASLPVPPIVFVFGALVLLYRAAQTVTNVTFFGLLRDVVPDTHMGRFLALFRLFGAGTTFILTYWLLGMAISHAKPIFIGIAVLNLLGFSAICWFVREGSYPPAETIGEDARQREGRTGRWQAVATFVRESYRHPIYLWTYFVRVCLYGALLGLSGFAVFFPQHELGMDLAAVGRLMAWPSLVWVFIAYPMGRLIDAKGALFVLQLGLVVITAGYGLSYVFVVGPKTYLISSLVTGVAFWLVMVAQLKLTQEIFHPMRYSQLAGANTIVQSLLIAIVISPAAGWLLDVLKGTSFTVDMPWVGDVAYGPYRLVNLMMAVLYGAAWFGVIMVKRHREALGGRDGYVAPL